MSRFAGSSASPSARRAIVAGKRAFGPNWPPAHIAIAPGRIELLGNHVDYNGGPVLAAAIDRFIAVAIAGDAGTGATLRVATADLPGEPVEAIDAAELGGWRNPAPPPSPFDYARGLLATLDGHADGPGLTSSRLPASIAIAGDVPIGVGVSSSAALCVALVLAVSAKSLAAEEIVLLAQEAEHRAGTPCGTMDQSASVTGGVIAFDGATLSVERLDPALGDLVFAVVDSGVERSLSTSSYPARVSESREALRRANAALSLDLPHLAMLTNQQLDELDARGALPGTLAARARHVVEETSRVAAGRDAALAGDWRRFGALMTASGRSSATLYDISHPDVEDLVAQALRVDGVLGARMMGGGEGGAALILLPRAIVPALESTLVNGYYRQRAMDGKAGLIHVCAFAPGAALISAESFP